jgi:D-glycero-D-manno-heptose 1,7-bisphosphate phosphatase
MMKLIILDRDGVINEDSDQFIKSADEWVPLPGSLEAISLLNRAGYRVVVISNQSGLGRGLFDIQTLNTIHEKMQQCLSVLGGHIESIFFCPHSPADDCDCRKPKAGLFLDLQHRLNVSLTDVPAVGDSLRDIQAARLVNASPILVRTGKGEATLAQGEGLDGVPVYADLAEFTNQLLAHQ